MTLPETPYSRANISSNDDYRNMVLNSFIINSAINAFQLLNAVKRLCVEMPNVVGALYRILVSQTTESGEALAASTPAETQSEPSEVRV